MTDRPTEPTSEPVEYRTALEIARERGDLGLGGNNI